MRCLSVGGGCGQAFDLLQVVDVVSTHGFDDGPEGHGAAFGVGGGAAAILSGNGCEEEEIPVAGGLEEGECRFERVGLVAFGPGVLVEGLDDGVGLVQSWGQGLTKAEGEDDLTVREVGGDLTDAPFAGGGAGVDLRFREVGGEGANVVGCRGEDGDRILTVKIGRVWV